MRRIPRHCASSRSAALTRAPRVLVIKVVLIPQPYIRILIHPTTTTAVIVDEVKPVDAGPVHRCAHTRTCLPPVRESVAQEPPVALLADAGGDGVAAGGAL